MGSQPVGSDFNTNERTYKVPTFKIEEGCDASDSGYGIECADSCKFPAKVIDQSRVLRKVLRQEDQQLLLAYKKISNMFMEHSGALQLGYHLTEMTRSLSNSEDSSSNEEMRVLWSKLREIKVNSS